MGDTLKKTLGPSAKESHTPLANEVLRLLMELHTHPRIHMTPANVVRARTPKNVAWERFTIYLPPDVAKALRHHVVDAGGDMSDVAAEALRKFLSEAKHG
jgi:hypothetical protein